MKQKIRFQKERHILLKNRKIVFVFFYLFFLGIQAQENSQKEYNENVVLTPEKARRLIANESLMEKWLEELVTPGVIIEGQNMKFSNEARRLIDDEAYRNSVYKDQYTFLDVKNSLLDVNIQKAFWQMIVMYPENKKQVLEYIYSYDKKIKTDEVITASFYTYAFFDPKITTIENNKPNIYRPDLFEEYFRRTKEIVNYIAFFRKQE